MDTNRETILDELIDFDKKRPNDISTILENYLSQIAKTGDPMFPWNKLKPLIRQKLEIVISEFYEACPTDNLPPLPNVDNFKYDDLRCKILEAVDTFPNAPFTIQRLCELLTSPKKHYQRTDKFMRGLEKNILVVSTVEPRSTEHSEVNNNNNLIMNGIIESSAVADMLSAENINLTSRAVMNGTPPHSDNYHSDFPSENGSIDAAVDSESSSSSDSDSSSDSLPPDYAIKDNHMDSVVDSTSTLQVESAMDTSPDNLERSEQEEPEEVVSSSCGVEEKDVSQDEGMNPEDDVGSLIADSTECQPSTESREDDGADETTSPQSSECHIESASKADDEEETEEREESPSETERIDSSSKVVDPIEEVAESLSEALNPEPTSPPLLEPIEDKDDVVEKADESSSEADAKPEQEKAVLMDQTCEPHQSDEVLVEKQAPDKTEPMEED